MKLNEFEKVVHDAVQGLPEVLRTRIENVQIVVRNARRSRRQSGAKDESDLYGLYEGTALPDRSAEQPPLLPDRVTLFKDNIEADFSDRAGMIRCIQETIVHELGHYFGFDDEKLDTLGLG